MYAKSDFSAVKFVNILINLKKPAFAWSPKIKEELKSETKAAKLVAAMDAQSRTLSAEAKTQNTSQDRRIKNREKIKKNRGCNLKPETVAAENA